MERMPALSPEQMDGLLEKFDERGISSERLQTLIDSVDDREHIMDILKTEHPELANGNVDSIVRDLEMYKQEAALNKTWLQKTGEVLAAPFKRAGGFLWRHKGKIAAAVVLGLLTYAAYQYGIFGYLGGKLGQWGSEWGLTSAAPEAATAVEAAAETASTAGTVAIEGGNVVVNGIAFNPVTQVKELEQAIQSALQTGQEVSIPRTMDATAKAKDVATELLEKHRVAFKFLPHAP